MGAGGHRYHATRRTLCTLGAVEPSAGAVALEPGALHLGPARALVLAQAGRVLAERVEERRVGVVNADLAFGRSHHDAPRIGGRRQARVISVVQAVAQHSTEGR